MKPSETRAPEVVAPGLAHDHVTSPHDSSAVARLQEAAIELIGRLDFVSFCEVVRDLERVGPTRGSLALTLGSDPNVILWDKLSPELVEALSDLFASQRIELWPVSSLLVYAADGGLLNLPIARPNRKKPYRRPHWLACTLRLNAAARLKRRMATS